MIPNRYIKIRWLHEALVAMKKTNRNWNELTTEEIEDLKYAARQADKEITL